MSEFLQPPPPPRPCVQTCAFKDGTIRNVGELSAVSKDRFLTFYIAISAPMHLLTHLFVHFSLSQTLLIILVLSLFNLPPPSPTHYLASYPGRRGKRAVWYLLYAHAYTIPYIYRKIVRYMYASHVAKVIAYTEYV